MKHYDRMARQWHAATGYNGGAFKQFVLNDLLIDAIDSLNPKVQLLTRAVDYGIPIISSMGAALRTDPTQVMFGDIFETKNCPLARRLRKRLRRNNITGGIPCVFSTEKVDFTYHDPEPVENPRRCPPHD